MFGGRRVLVAAAAGFLLFGFGTAGSALAEVEPGTESGASVDQAGWWWKKNDHPDGADALAGVPKPPPPTLEGKLPVEAVNGEAEMISAVGFALDANPGATVSAFEVSLRESEDPGANVNAEEAVIVACPLLDGFWEGNEAGTWRSQPEFDCDSGVQGERSDDGVWTFDLAAVAGTWLAPDNDVATAVMLTPDVEAPMSFQVAFAGPEDDGIGVLLTATGGAPPAPPAGTGATGGTTGTGDSGSAGTADIGGGVPESSDIGGGDTSAEIGEAPEAAEVPATAEDAGTPQPQVAAGAQPTGLESVFQALPGGLWVLVPLALGIAYLIMLALGPAGEPGAETRRRGVSQALDRWRSAKATGGAA